MTIWAKEIKMIKDYKCSDCYYCDMTNNFFTRWCTYWNKVTFLTSGCARETTVLDYDYVDSLDEDEDFNL